MVTYYDFVLCRFPLTRTYMGGANYLKKIINAWKTAFTIPTEKQRCLERATRLVVYIPLPSFYDKVAYPSRYDTSWLELSPDVGHFVYRSRSL